MISHLRQFRVSSKKANLVAALVRNKKVEDAVDILRFTPKKTALVLKKLIESAAANAEHNDKQKRESLVVDQIIVTEGPTYKRRVMVSRGRAHPILKRTAHITVKLRSEEAVKPEVKDAKPEVKTEKAEAPAKTKVAAKKEESKPEEAKK